MLSCTGHFSRRCAERTALSHRSETHDRTQKAAEQSVKSRIAFERRKTHAVRILPDDGPMIHIVAGLVEISRKILAALVSQRS